MKGRVWINFKELRARLKFEDVLGHFGVEVSSKGNQHQGPCPLPGHTGVRGPRTFSANLERGIFQCFSCGTKGNTLEFAALMSGVDPEDGAALRKVAVELQTRFCPEGASTRTKAKAAPSMPPQKAGKAPQRLVNAPLDFALKDLDSAHPYFDQCGLREETIRHFGLGFCSRGMLKDQVAIPLHDPIGKLIGYAGCAVDDSAANQSYHFPPQRERNGIVYEFDQSLLLYNAHRIEGPCDDLIVVQWFPSVWWLHQHDYPKVVALMDTECPDRQAELLIGLVKPSGRLWLMPDGDKIGALAQSLLTRLSPYRFTRWVKLDEGRRPTDCPAGEINSCFSK